jgi:hypothetical protein
MQKESSANQQTIQMSIPYHTPEPMIITPVAAHPPQSPPTLGLRTRGRSPLSARTDDITPWVESPHYVSPVGSTLITAPTHYTEAGDANQEDAEFRRKLQATRMRRLTEHEFLRPGKMPRGTVDV